MLGRSDYSGSAGESQGFPFPQPQRISQNGASTCPSFSLGLPLLEPGWLGLAFQRPGSGSLGVWPWGPSFYISSGFRGPWLHGIHWVSLSSCLLTLGLSESLSLVFWVPVFLGVRLSPPLLTFLVLTEVGKCRQRCQAPWPPKKPLPHSFLRALEWCGRGQEMGCAICLAQGWHLVGGLCSPPGSHP